LERQSTDGADATDWKGNPQMPQITQISGEPTAGSIAFFFLIFLNFL
jgi:hypothetical protein